MSRVPLFESVVCCYGQVAERDAEFIAHISEVDYRVRPRIKLVRKLSYLNIITKLATLT